MPRCNCPVDGVGEEWEKEPEIIKRLNEYGRMILSPDETDLNPCNKHVAHNALILRPLIQKMSEQAEWQLFSLDAISRELLAMEPVRLLIFHVDKLDARVGSMLS